MKRCPTCNDFALYEDDLFECPICGSYLEVYSRNAAVGRRPTVPGSSSMDYPVSHTVPVSPVTPADVDVTRAVEPYGTGQSTVGQRTDRYPQFEQRSGRDYIFRGTITEIHSLARYPNRMKKIINSLFHAEPYQFGNTAHATILRIEEFSDRLSGQKRDVTFYGDVEGYVSHNDDVRVVCRRVGSRYIVRRMYSLETDSAVTPAPYISAAVVRFIALVLLALIVCLVIGVGDFVQSGAAAELGEGLLILVGILLVCRYAWRRRFRR